jgi:hypothetical protein
MENSTVEKLPENGLPARLGMLNCLFSRNIPGESDVSVVTSQDNVITIFLFLISTMNKKRGLFRKVSVC